MATGKVRPMKVFVWIWSGRRIFQGVVPKPGVHFPNAVLGRLRGPMTNDRNPELHDALFGHPFCHLYLGLREDMVGRGDGSR